jgi:two-component system sensor histidine kinase RpfC
MSPLAAGRISPLTRAAVSAARARLRNRPDNEHEMVLNRLIIGPLVFLYLAAAALLGDPSMKQEFFLVIGGYVALSMMLGLHLVRHPGISETRRVLALALDLGTLSYGLHVGGGLTALLYPIYLWTIFGNGFRFGIRYLYISAAGSVFGFAVVIAVTEYWRANPSLAAGLLIGLIILPVYAGTLIRKLSDAKRLAEDASRAKSLFLASVSHELRTPLNAVIGMSDLLRETRLDNEQRDMAGTIGTSGRALLSLINELLDFSRIEAGHMPLQKIDFDLHATLTEVKSMVKAQARAKGIRVALHVTPRTPYALHGDRRHLQEILINLAGNAVKFTDSGSVVIAADMVAGGDGKARLRFEVIDTGIGIRPEAQGRIFESFTQADETIINRYGGTGLGLAICKQLTALLGGTLGVESEYGSGSTFSLELDFDLREPALPNLGGLQVLLLSPDASGEERLKAGLEDMGARIATVATVAAARALLAAPAAEVERHLILVDQRIGAPAEAGAALSELDTEAGLALILEEGSALPASARDRFVAGLAPGLERSELLATAHLAVSGSRSADSIGAALEQSAGRSLSVLVAEDNSVNQKVVTKILERGGHRVRVVDNGEQAVDVLLEGNFDLVLMDINMPVMSGIEATKLYRFAALGRPRVPIIALTADATPDVRERCLAAGMDDCLPKPIEARDLFQLLARFTPADGGQEQAAATIVPDDIVTDIAAHPKFRGESRPVMDRAKLAELESLGGRAFMVDLAEEFLAEGTQALREIEEALKHDDVVTFRDRLHAMRSGAANIGALSLYDVLLSLRAISGADFRAKGLEHTREIAAEFARIEAALLDYCAGRETPPASVSKLQKRSPA